MFAPTWTLLHTFNRHNDHHYHHHIMIIIRLKFATPSEQYVDWGNNINLIFMMGQNLPPPLNYMLTGGSNINNISMRDQHSPPPIFMRDQNSPRPMNNMLIGVTTSTLSSYPPEVRCGATSGLQRTCWNGSIATIRGQIAMFVGKSTIKLRVFA